MYHLPKFDRKKILAILSSQAFKITTLVVAVIVVLVFAYGQVQVGIIKNQLNSLWQNSQIFTTPESTQKLVEEYAAKLDYEKAIIQAVKSASPSVVSIIISKNLPVYERRYINPFGDLPDVDVQVPQYVQRGTELREIGAGSGFIVSEDGLVLTNKHVVIDKEAEYTILTNDGKKYSGKVLALDPVQDLAVIKIQLPPNISEKFPAIKLGDSSAIQIGQTAIAIGNALGEFRNTISVGVISGLGRTVTASGKGGFSEVLDDAIQTDAAINPGNSGGPLLNLQGEVIGINVAMAQGAQTIGFAIPINLAKRDINQVISTNKISYPLIGIRYVLVNDEIKKKYSLTLDYGALVIKGENGEQAVIKDSPAAAAGLEDQDLILELNGEKITEDNSLGKIISKYNPGETIFIKFLRGGKEMVVQITLGER